MDQFSLRLATLAALFTISVGTASAHMEVYVDRPGGDYANYDLPENDAGHCESDCLRDSQCRAWTYVQPGVQGAMARCWLKNSVPDPVPNQACCVSGTAHPMEWDVNRVGGDIADFDLPGPDPGLCRVACVKETQCRSWTYVRPNMQGPNARCWLKKGTPARRADTCCVSGIK